MLLLYVCRVTKEGREALKFFERSRCLARASEESNDVVALGVGVG